MTIQEIIEKAKEAGSYTEKDGFVLCPDCPKQNFADSIESERKEALTCAECVGVEIDPNNFISAEVSIPPEKTDTGTNAEPKKDWIGGHDINDGGTGGK